MIPRLISGCPKLADSAAIRKSHAIASSQPPPNASALTAAMVAIDERSMSRSRPCAASSSSRPALSSMLVKALMSAPAQNSIGLADANTNARTEPPPLTVSHASRSTAIISGESELAGGRSSQAIAICSRVSSLTGRSTQPAIGARVGIEALPGLDPEPAGDDQSAQDRGRLVGVAPALDGRLELVEHDVEPGLVRALKRRRHDPGPGHHPEVDFLASPPRPPRAPGTPRPGP